MQSMFDKNPPKVFVQPSSIHGLGVFAAQDITSGEIIEKAPILKLDIQEKDALLADYRFWWEQDGKRIYYVLALGYGSLYNHSSNPSGYFTNNIEDYTIDFIATKDIKKGEEILVDYGGEEYWSSRKYVEVK
jgi:SET domain-containing protein